MGKISFLTAFISCDNTTTFTDLELEPNVSAEEDFFFTSEKDKVICYHCGVGLRDWNDKEDPWTCHRKWFSKCTFILLSEGQGFVSKSC